MARPPTLALGPIGVAAGLVAVLTAACTSVPSSALERLRMKEPSADQEYLEESAWPATPEFVDGEEWIRLVSGEWLKGELVSLRREALDFDSDKLDELSLDWEDVAQVITTRPFDAVRADGVLFVGEVHVAEAGVFVRTSKGIVRFPRAELTSLVQDAKGRSAWSGQITVGGTRRSGNTNQTDLTTRFAATRRTARDRTTLSLDTVLSEISGATVTDNQLLRGRQDAYVSPRFFLTPFGFELFRDPIQNIELRATPYAGLGYTLVEHNNQELDATLNLGYRYNRFSSVAVGEDDSRSSIALLVGTSYELEVTKSVDLEFVYQAQIGLDNDSSTDQNANLLLSFEFLWDLDFDVRFVWNRVGQPEPGNDGITPERDDFRIDLGLSWSF